MRIAIPYDNGNIFPHFGHAEMFKLYNLEDGQIVSGLTIPTFGSGHAAMAEFLKTARADVLICGGIGGSAQRAVASLGIAIYPGFGGSADDAVRAFASGSLQRGASHDCESCSESCGEGGCPHHHGDGGCGHHHEH